MHGGSRPSRGTCRARGTSHAAQRASFGKHTVSPFDADAVAREAVARSGATPDPKRPLFRPLPPAPAFPMHALGALREPVEAIQMRTQAPHAMCAQSGLGAATLAVQAHRDVELPGSGRRPLTGLFGSVAESGERKTTVDRIALAPAYRIEEKGSSLFGMGSNDLSLEA